MAQIYVLFIYTLFFIGYIFIFYIFLIFNPFYLYVYRCYFMFLFSHTLFVII
jgi:hypothetical protein